MRWSVINRLLDANLLLVGKKQGVARKRNNRSGNTAAAARKIKMNYVLLSGVYLLLYGRLAFDLPLKLLPNMYLQAVLMFFVLGLLQSFLSVFNVFYESRDLPHFRPLPIHESEVIVAKLGAVLLSSLYFYLPLAAYVLVLAFQSLPAPFAAVVGLVSVVLVTVMLLLLAIVLAYGLTKIASFQRYQKRITTAVTTLSLIGMVVGLVILNSSLQNVQELTLSAISGQIAGYLQPLWVLYGLATQPISLAVGLHLMVWLAIIALGVWVIATRVRRSLYQDSERLQQPAAKSSRARQRQPKAVASWSAWVRRYHWSLLKDGQLITNVLLMPIVYVILLFGPLIMQLGGVGRAFAFDVRQLVLAWLLGVGIALLSVHSGSLVAIIISLDRENHQVFRVLPISYARYLRDKFVFAFIVQSLVPFSILTLGLLYLNVSPLVLLMVLVSWLLAGFALSCYLFARDYRLLRLNWHSVTELLIRGSGAVMRALIGFAIVLGSILVGGAVYNLSLGLTTVQVWLYVAVLLAVLVLLAGLSYSYYYRGLFKKVSRL